MTFFKVQQLRDAEKSAQDTYNAAKKQEVEAQAALDLAEKQEADEEKKRAIATAAAEAGFITFVSAELVSRCRIPVAAVAQRELLRILLGSGAPSTGSNVQQKGGLQSSRTCFSDGKTCFDGYRETTIDVDNTYIQDSSSSMYNNYTFTTTG